VSTAAAVVAAAFDYRCQRLIGGTGLADLDCRRRLPSEPTRPIRVPEHDVSRRLSARDEYGAVASALLVACLTSALRQRKLT